MAIYAVGDIQGCQTELEALLGKLDFQAGRDQIWFTGDLVNRGPHSLQTLRFARQLGDNAVTVLGNHDLHLLAVAEGLRRLKGADSMRPILSAPDRDELLHWLRHRPLAHADKSLRTLLVHAGVYVGWGRKKALRRAAEVEQMLRSDDYLELLRHMYGRKPTRWRKELKGWDRPRFIINAFTRMRYCDARGNLEYSCKGPPGSQAPGLAPWFRHPRRHCKKWRIVFGHWSSLGLIVMPKLISLDTGCVWG
ncbi:MAG: symmetrical bis(5'-nucleosyl)-tetraphosphatase, partial [Pseudomonadota bacterium]|nr:symmetrical bis(5'-nucleosyl)-tetraphosphatase [Pseudomonadota bacterium]